MRIVVILGYSGSGKTTAILELIRFYKLHKRRVAVIKHTHEALNLDKKGKDTWLFTESGATAVVAVSPTELYIRSPVDAKFRDVMNLLRSERIDYLLIEGWHKEARVLGNAKTLTCVRSIKEAKDLLVRHHNPVAFVGKLPVEQIRGVPVYQIPRDTVLLSRLLG